MQSVSPQLAVRRGREAIAFYRAAFGAVERYRVADRRHEAVVARLAVGGAAFWVADESPEHQNFSPESLGGCSVQLLLIVEDPQAVVERAVGRGRHRGLPGSRRARLAARPHRRPVRPPLGDRQAAGRLAPASVSYSSTVAMPARRVAVARGRSGGHRVVERLELVPR